MLLEDHVHSLVGEFAESQVASDEDALVAAYESLLEIGPTVIDCLSVIVADANSPYRIAAIDLLECFHPLLDSTTALPSLRSAMKEADPWLWLCAAEAVWVIEGESPCDIADDSLAVIRELAAIGSGSVDLSRKVPSWDKETHNRDSETPHTELARVRRRAASTLRTIEELRRG